jgi:hypothetical protein
MGGAGQVRWAENQAVWVDFTFTVSTIQGHSEVDYVEIFLAPHLFGSHSEEQFNPEERVQRPETLRLRGELHLENGQPDLAQADFRDSISLARSMGAKAWELRTTMSLARLLASQGFRDKARTILAGIYDCFTEGFDTPDLINARTLLDELSG